LRPCIPSSWPSYSIEWRFGRTLYTIDVENPEGRCSGAIRAELDGSLTDPEAIPLRDDGRPHRVWVLLGAERDAPSGCEPLPASPAGTERS
jgi:cellobiose phosphorylase